MIHDIMLFILVFCIGAILLLYVNKLYIKIATTQKLDIGDCVPTIELKYNDKKYRFIVDTGAEVSLLSEKFLDELNASKLNKKDILISFSGDEADCEYCNIRMLYNRFIELNIDCAILDSSSNLLYDDIAGVIGNQCLIENSFVVDFSKLKMYVNAY